MVVVVVVAVSVVVGAAAGFGGGAVEGLVGVVRVVDAGIVVAGVVIAVLGGVAHVVVVVSVSVCC